LKSIVFQIGTFGTKITTRPDSGRICCRFEEWPARIAADGLNSVGLYASRVSPPTADMGRAARIALNPDDLDQYRLAAQTQVIRVVAMVRGRGAARA
jgi:hypothetical protein